MERIYFSVEDDGFFGCYYPLRGRSEWCMLGQFGDNVDDPLAKCGAKYFHDLGLNVMALAPAKGSYEFHDYPIERYGKAIEAVKRMGNRKIAICGASTVGMTSLVAASYYPDITLTIAMTPSDFIMEGYYKDGLDGSSERPGNGKESTLSWEGRPLPFRPFTYRHPEYDRVLKESAKKNGDRARSLEIFTAMDEAGEPTEEQKIKIENIKGHIMFIGAYDDVMWPTCDYIKRMDRRLQEKEHDSTYQTLLYDHCTHFVFPEGIFRKFAPGIGTLMTGLMFKAGREYPRECKESRMDIDERISCVIRKWVSTD